MSFIDFNNFTKKNNSFGFGRKKPQEFWLKKGQSKEIVFIDEAPFVLREHSVRANDGKFETHQCIGSECPLCDKGNVATAVYCLTVIELREWTDRTGETHKESYQLFKFKQKAAIELKKIKEKHGRLKGLKIEAKREDTQYAGKSGNKFFYIEDASNYLEEYSEVDYIEVFEMPSKEKLYQVASRTAA